MNFRLFLLPVSAVYASLSGLRNFLFDKKIFKSTRFEKPIILVGNLSMGGTGKTPHVEYLINLLRHNYKLATLSRGYGRNTKGFVLGGKGATASTIGDEPMQYLSKFDDVTVAVCEDRVEGANRLFSLPQPPDVIIMDDGFQHRKIEPGFKILLTPYDHIYTRDYLLPAGNLRESRTGFKRANCIIVTKSPEKLSDPEKAKIILELNPQSGQQVFFSRIIYDALQSLFTAEKKEIDELKEMNVLLFTGIENPKPLQDFLSNKCKSLTSIKFPDHHAFTEKDVRGIREKFNKFANGKSLVLTTEKDYQRLKGSPLLLSLSDLPCYFIPLIVQIDRENDFNTILKNYVKEN